MAWRVYADVFDSGELANISKSQSMIVDVNTFIKAIRTTLVLVGTPTFTNLKMKIYDNNAEGNTPSVLKSESINSFNVEDLLKVHPHGIIETYFEFTPFNTRKDDRYHIVLNADTYSPTQNSFIAWRNVWPDPVYSTNYTATGTNYLASPYMITAVIGSRA